MDRELQFAMAYTALGKRKQRLLQYMLKQDNQYFKGNYTDLAIKMCGKIDENRNVRNEVKVLELINLIVVYRSKKNRCLGIRMRDDWREMLLKWYATENTKDYFLTNSKARELIKGI